MLQAEKNDLTLNIVPVALSMEKIQVGGLPFKSEDDYTQLREQHWKTHAFRYDSRTGKITNVTLQSGAMPLGHVEDANANKHLLLIAKAIQQSILIWLAGRRPILKAGKKLIFCGRVDTALLLTQAIKTSSLIPVPGLEAVICYEINCRMFLDSSDTTFQ